MLQPDSLSFVNLQNEMSLQDPKLDNASLFEMEVYNENELAYEEDDEVKDL